MKHTDKVIELARKGALVEIEGHKIGIRVMEEFLRDTDPAVSKLSETKPVATENKVTKKGRRRKKMSAALRKATSERMKKFWAAKRAAKKK